MVRVVGKWGEGVRTLLVAVAVATLFAWGAWAAETGGALSPEQAAELALKHDVNAQIAELNWENARISYERSLAQNLLDGSEVSRKAAERSLLTAEIAYANRRADVVAAAVNAYFSVLNAELTLAIRQAQLHVAQLSYDSTVRQAQMGTANNLDLLDAELSVESGRINLRNAEEALAAAREALARSLGISAESLPQLLEDPPVPAVAVDAENAVNRALERNTNVINAQAALEEARLNLEQARVQGVAPLNLRSSEIAVKIAELELGETLRSARASAESTVEAVTEAKESLDMELVRFDAAVRRHDLTRQQFEAGLRTQTERIQAEISLLQARQSRLSSLANYYAAVFAYLKLVGDSPNDAFQGR